MENCLKKHLSISPVSIKFESYEASKRYTKKITIINMDKDPTQICVRFNETRELKIQISGNQKLLPGLNVKVEVVFCPIRGFQCQMADRRFEITIFGYKSKTQHSIPIILTSPFFNISIPESLLLPPTTAGISTYATFFIVNPGESIEEFSIQSPSNFKIKPSKKKFTLKPLQGETVVLEASFPQPGTVCDELKVIFRRNIPQQMIAVKCTVSCAKLEFTENILNFPDTTPGESSMLTTELCNNSADQLDFEFGSMPDANDEVYGRYLAYHYDRINDILYEGVISRDVHSNILDRQLAECRVAKINVPFRSNCFDISPMHGVVAAQSKTTINVAFRPPIEFEPGYVDVCARLCECPDMQGLTLRGTIVGAHIVFNPVKYDFGLIQVGEAVKVSVECRNNGYVETVLDFDSFDAKFGGEIKVTPRRVELEPHDVARFCVHYSNKNVGKFIEDLIFGGDVRFTLTGEVLPLKVSIKPAAINFHDVAICCGYQKKMTVENMSDMAVTVHIKTPQFNHTNLVRFQEFFFTARHNDDDDEANNENYSLKNIISAISFVSDIKSCDDVARDKPEETESSKIILDVLASVIDAVVNSFDLLDNLLWNLLSPPSRKISEPFVPFKHKPWILSEDATEYNCHPNELHLRGREKTQVVVQLTPNWPGTFKNYITLEATGNPMPIYIPLNHNCIVPQLTLSETEFELQSIVGFTAMSQIVITNPSSVHGFVEVFYNPLKEAKLTVVPMKEMIPPKKNRTFLIQMKAMHEGIFKSCISFNTLGACHGTEVLVTCTTSVAIVKVQPKSVVKTVNILQDVRENVSLENPNAVAINYKLTLKTGHGDDDAIRIKKCEGVINPCGSRDVEIHAFFFNPGKHAAKMMIHFDMGTKMEIKLTFHAIGTPLIMQPTQETFDLGKLLAGIDFPTINFSIQNASCLPYCVKIQFNECRMRIKNSERQLAPKATERFTVKLTKKFAGIVDELIKILVAAPSKNKVKTFDIFHQYHVLAEVLKPCVTFDVKRIMWKTEYGKDLWELPDCLVLLQNSTQMMICLSLSLEEDEFTFALKDSIEEKVSLNPDERIEVQVGPDQIPDTTETTIFEGNLVASIDGRCPVGTVQLFLEVQHPKILISDEFHTVTKSFMAFNYAFTIENVAEIAGLYEWTVENFTYDLDKPPKPKPKQTDQNQINFIQNYLDTMNQKDLELDVIEEPEPLVQEKIEKPKKLKYKGSKSGKTKFDDSASIMTTLSKKSLKKVKKKRSKISKVTITEQDDTNYDEIEIAETEIDQIFDEIDEIFSSKVEAQCPKHQVVLDDLQDAKKYLRVDRMKGNLAAGGKECVYLCLKEHRRCAKYSFDLVLTVEGGNVDRTYFEVKNEELKI